MTQEQRNTLVVTLGGLWLSFISAYGIITVGANWIFSVGILMGALLFLPGMWEIIFHWAKKGGLRAWRLGLETIKASTFSFIFFRVVNMASNEETQYFLKEEIYMIEVMTKNYEVRLRKENYDGFTVTSPNGINTPFWTALTEVLEVEPWAETITIKENSIISAGDLDR